MRKTLAGLMIFLLPSLTATAQQYLVFENLKGKNSRKISTAMNMSMNHVELVSGDSTLNLYNWLITPNESTPSEERLGGGNPGSPVIIVAVPLNVDGQKVRKIKPDQLKTLDILSPDSLISQTLKALAKHREQRTILMPPLKTLDYGLIIKTGEEYEVVETRVLVCQFMVDYAPTYFPEEYRNGMLSVHPENRPYQFKEIDQLEKEFRKKKLPHTWLNKIVNRIYLSTVEQNSALGASVFHFWEYPSDDVVSSLLPLKQLHEFNMGLGSFEYLPQVGIINATLDTFLKKQILFQQPSRFKIKSINGLGVADYGKSLTRQ